MSRFNSCINKKVMQSNVLISVFFKIDMLIIRPSKPLIGQIKSVLVFILDYNTALLNAVERSFHLHGTPCMEHYEW